MSRPGEVLFFEKSYFSDQIRFCSDLLLILVGFGSHFGGQSRAKMRSKINEKSDGILDRSLKSSWALKGVPGGFRSACPGSTGRGRGGVNPPQGRGGKNALKDLCL